MRFHAMAKRPLDLLHDNEPFLAVRVDPGKRCAAIARQPQRWRAAARLRALPSNAMLRLQACRLPDEW
jgi:hypothetical protein